MVQLEFVDDDEIPYSLLHLFFWGSVFLVCFTLFFSILVYAKILHNKEYRNRFVYRLIVFNGITNYLQFAFYTLSIHLGIFPTLRSIIIYLNEYNWTTRFLYFFMVSISAQSHSNLTISSNRLFSLTHQFTLKSYERSFYWISLISSIIIPLFLSFPILYSDYHYVERRMIKSGESIFRTEMSRNHIGPLPVGIYALVTNILAIISNVAMIFYLWKENKKKKKNNIVNKDIRRVENGLVVSTALNGIIHLVLYAVAFMTASLSWIGAGATLILFIALSSILPFWLLVSLVPSLRKELPFFHLPIGINPDILFSFTPSIIAPIPKNNPTNKKTVTAVRA